VDSEYVDVGDALIPESPAVDEPTLRARRLDGGVLGMVEPPSG